MDFPRRIFDGDGVKGDVDFGPTLMLNRQRCILCTRCVRFMRDVDGDAQINIIDRGYGSEIATFQEEGVHSPDLGQSDGCVPRWRDHHARLPVQVEAVGQPERRRHDLHAVREGLQRHRLDQGQTRMGERRPAGAVDSAVQPGRQRLLDVRHRALQLSLDRRRRSPAPAARARRDNRGTRGPASRGGARLVARRDLEAARRLAAAGAANPGGVRFLLSAHASHEELFLFRRLTEELLGQDGPGAISVVVAPSAEDSAGAHAVPGPSGRRARTSTAPGYSGSFRAVSATRRARRMSRRSEGCRGWTRVGPLRLRPRTGRLAGFHRLDHRSARARDRSNCSWSRVSC